MTTFLPRASKIEKNTMTGGLLDGRNPHKGEFECVGTVSGCVVQRHVKCAALDIQGRHGIDIL